MDEKLKRELYDKLMDKFDSLYADLQNFVQEIAEDLSIEELSIFILSNWYRHWGNDNRMFVFDF